MATSSTKCKIQMSQLTKKLLPYLGTIEQLEYKVAFWKEEYENARKDFIRHRDEDGREEDFMVAEHAAIMMRKERDFLFKIVLSLKNLIENDNHSTTFLVDLPEYAELIDVFENYKHEEN